MHKFDFISYKRHFQLIISKFWLIVYINQIIMKKKSIKLMDTL